MGEINLGNSKGRDAVVAYQSVRGALRVRYMDADGRPARSVRLAKSTIEHDLDALVAAFGDLAAVGPALIASDPEIDFEHAGGFLRDTTRVYLDSDRHLVHRVRFEEVVRNPDGSERARRPRQVSVPNVQPEAVLRWSGKLLKKAEVYHKFVFSNKLQIVHVNGLTYDFLYGMAKELEEASSMLLLGAGPKSNQPLIFRRGATPYRGFLEGRTQGDRYCLLLHLSNLELKVPERVEAPQEVNA